MNRHPTFVCLTCYQPHGSKLPNFLKHLEAQHLMPFCADLWPQEIKPAGHTQWHGHVLPRWRISHIYFCIAWTTTPQQQ